MEQRTRSIGQITTAREHKQNSQQVLSVILFGGVWVYAAPEMKINLSLIILKGNFAALTFI